MPSGAAQIHTIGGGVWLPLPLDISDICFEDVSSSKKIYVIPK